MNKLRILLYMCIAVFTLNSCTDEVDPQDTNFVTFETESYDFGVDIDGENTNEINVYAYTVSTSERILNVAVVSSGTTADAAAYIVPTTVTIPANSNRGTLSVTVADFNISPAGETIEIGFESEEGLFVSNNIVLNVALVCPNNGIKVKLELTFDSWPEEVQWRVEDANGNIVMEGSPNHQAYAGEYAGMSGTIEISECLASGSYTLIVEDDYADGGTAFKIFAAGVLVDSLSGSGYSASGSVAFSI